MADVFPTPSFYDEKILGSSQGLNKRELFAAMAMQGLIASGSVYQMSEIAEMAVGYADSLLIQLEMNSHGVNEEHEAAMADIGSFEPIGSDGLPF